MRNRLRIAHSKTNSDDRFRLPAGYRKGWSMLKKGIVILLILSMLAALLSACGSTSDPGTQADTETKSGEPGSKETDATETEARPEAKFEVPDDLAYDSEFTILTCPGENPTTDFYWVQFGEYSINGDILNDAIYDRNKALEEYLGITLVLNTSGHLTNTTAYENAVTAGDKDGTCDLGVWIDRFALNVAQKGMVLPFSEMEKNYVDLSKPWWYQSVNETLSIDHKLFFAAGYFNLDLFGMMQMLLVNRNIVEDKQLEDPYDLVDSRAWTMDIMYSMMLEAATDVDGDDAMTEEDVWGAVKNGSMWNNNYISVSGEKFVAKDSQDIPYLNMEGNEHLLDILSMLVEDLTAPEVTMEINKAKIYNKGHVYENIVSMFADGHALFAGTSATYMGNIRNSEVDYGIVPFPPYEAIGKNEEYKSYNIVVIAHIVPTTCQDPVRTSAVLEAMAYFSYTGVVPQFVESVLQLRNVRDEKSGDIMRMLNRNMDIELGQAYWYDQIMAGTVSKIFGGGINTYASTLAENKSKIEQAIEASIKVFEELEG